MHDPGDHDDSIEKAVERYLAVLEKAYGKPTFDMMMGRGPSGPDSDAYMDRLFARQAEVLARHKIRMAKLRSVVERL